MFLLSFGHILQYLPNIGDTVRIAVTYWDIDIGLVMLFKLASVIPSIPVSDIASVQTDLLRPRICIPSFTPIQPEHDVGMVVVIFGPFNSLS